MDMDIVIGMDIEAIGMAVDEEGEGISLDIDDMGYCEEMGDMGIPVAIEGMDMDMGISVGIGVIICDGDIWCDIRTEKKEGEESEKCASVYKLSLLRMLLSSYQFT